MSNTIFITANWTTGALSQQTISRQYDNNRYAVQFIGYPEGDGTEELDLYLLVWMSTAPGQKPGEITPIQLNSDQWYISNYFTQQVQVIKFQLCVLNEAGTYEAHSPIFSGRIGDSLEHDGTSQDIDVSTLFDAYREYIEELIIRVGAVIIDPTPTQGSNNAVSSGGVYAIVTELDEKLDETDFIAKKASDTLAVNGKNAILLYNITNGETANIYTTLLKAGHSYKLTPDKTTWEYKTPASGQTLFRISQVTEENGQEVETIIYKKLIGGEIDTSIMLQTPDNLKYMIFFIRCVKTEVLHIKITDLGETNPVIPGLSIEAKRALLACFEHVVWTNEHGQDYYDALREALSEDEYIYKLDNPLIVDGSTGYVIADVAPFIKKRSFSILADYTEGDIDFTVSNIVSSPIMQVSGAETGANVILSTYKPTNAKNVNTRATIFNTQYLVREPKENCGNRRIKFAVSYDSEAEKVTSLISLNGIIVTPYIDTTENDVVFYASENALNLGVNAEQTEVLKGTINEAKILNHTLTLAEMESYVTDVD